MFKIGQYKLRQSRVCQVVYDKGRATFRGQVKHVSDMLDSETINTLKNKLLTLRDELVALNESKESAADNIALDQSRVGRLSRMDALAAAAMGAETKRRRALQLKLITEALRRIDDGSYGECLECFELINPDRLELNPAIPLCIHCATKAENNAV